MFRLCTVGKERVFMSVAKMLDKKVYVEKTKWKMMVTESADFVSVFLCWRAELSTDFCPSVLFALYSIL